MSGDYLWDGTGVPDDEVQALEEMLAPLRHRGRAPGLRAPRVRVALSRRRHFVAALAAVVVMFGAAWLFRGMTGGGNAFEVATLAGTPRLGRDPAHSKAFGAHSIVAAGQWVVTDDASRAQIRLGDVGTVRVEPRSQIRVAETGARRHRLVLDFGALHAAIQAPPRLFIVDTPAARAVDMGCEYDLVIVEKGGGQLHVTGGWVMLEGKGHESIVPVGTSCTTWPDRGPGTPIADDASDALRRSVTDFDRNGDDSALLGVLATARPRDAITLVHLLDRVEDEWRKQILDRLVRYSPPPAEVDLDAAARGNADALATWRLDVVTRQWLEASERKARP